MYHRFCALEANGTLMTLVIKSYRFEVSSFASEVRACK